MLLGEVQTYYAPVMMDVLVLDMLVGNDKNKTKGLYSIVEKI